MVPTLQCMAKWTGERREGAELHEQRFSATFPLLYAIYIIIHVQYMLHVRTYHKFENLLLENFHRKRMSCAVVCA